MFNQGFVPFLYRRRIAVLISFSFIIFFITFLQYTTYLKNVKPRNNHDNNVVEVNIATNKAVDIIDLVQKPIFKPELIENHIKILKRKHDHKFKKIEEKDEKTEVKPGMIEILSKLDRIVHIDLKGAPPKPDYFKEFIPLIKKFGATGILIEYEDMFPFKGKLEVVKHGNAYKDEDVNLLLKLAKENNLTVMPLVQTYGHLEWLLKHKNFAHLRENPEFPQVITPCIEESYEVIFGKEYFVDKASC